MYEWAPWLLVLCIAGYPFVGMVGALLNLDSSTLSVPFRVGIVLLSVALLIHRPVRVEWLRGHRWLLASAAPGIPATSQSQISRSR